MSLFANNEEDFKEITNQIEQNIRDYNGETDPNKRATLQEAIESDMKEAAQTLDSMQMAANNDRGNKQLAVKVKQHEIHLQKQRAEYRKAQLRVSENLDRDMLLGGKRDEIMASSLDTRERMVKANEREQKGTRILEETLGVAHETLGIGIDTMQRLDEQESQMNKILGNLGMTNDQIARSRRLVKSMYRRAITNKVITAVIILVLVAAIVAVIYFAWIQPLTANADKKDAKKKTASAALFW